MNTTNESKETIEVLDEARQGETSTSTPAERFDASNSSNQEAGDPVFLPEEPGSSLPPPPRKKSGATLITLPADDTGQYTDSRNPMSTSKTHTRTNTFGTISYEKFESRERQPRAIKEEAETTSSRRF